MALLVPLQHWQSQLDVRSSSPNIKMDTEIPSSNTTMKKELRLGNAAVQDMRSVGHSTAPREGLLADRGDQSTATGRVSARQREVRGPKLRS